MRSCRQCDFDLCDGCFQGEEPTGSEGESAEEEWSAEEEELTCSESDSESD
jgi:hypothetical protein